MKEVSKYFIDTDIVKASCQQKAKSMGYNFYTDVLEKYDMNRNLFSTCKQNYSKYCRDNNKNYKEGIGLITPVMYNAIVGIFGLKTNYILSEEYVENTWKRSVKDTEKVNKKKKKSVKKEDFDFILGELGKVNKKLDNILKIQEEIQKSLKEG